MSNDYQMEPVISRLCCKFAGMYMQLKYYEMVLGLVRAVTVDEILGL